MKRRRSLAASPATRSTIMGLKNFNISIYRRSDIFEILLKTVPPVYIATIPRTGVAIPSKLVIPKLEPMAASFLLIAETIEIINVRPVKTS